VISLESRRRAFVETRLPDGEEQRVGLLDDEEPRVGLLDTEDRAKGRLVR
jgi:hypothetical protein